MPDAVTWESQTERASATATRPRSGGLRKSSVAAVVGVVAVTACVFASNVGKYYFIGDDSFISFRYAHHLIEGYGPVWNHGERVEGYTNFLWVLLMAGAMRLGIEPQVASNLLGIISGACLIGLLPVFSARLSSWRNPFIWLPSLVLSVSRSFTAWCTGGLETMFFTLVVFLGFWAFLEERERHVAQPVGSSLLFAVAALTRPEGALFMCIAGFFFAAETMSGKRRLRAGMVWLLPFVLVIGSHYLWRRAYYGYWLPNTFYAKVPAAWWGQGGRYCWLFAHDYSLGWFVPVVFAGLALRCRFANLLFASVIGVYVLYVAYVGGDRFEFRLFVVILPYVYWMIADALHSLSVWPAIGIARRTGWRAAGFAGAAALLLTTHLGSVRANANEVRYGVTTTVLINAYVEQRAQEGRFLRQLIDHGFLPADLTVAVIGAGALPYFTDWTTVDCLGLNDLKIAHSPLAKRGVIGHERHAPYDYLVERKVVIFDVLNRVVHDEADVHNLPRTVRYDGHELPLRIMKAQERYLAFATLAPEREFRRVFSKLEVVE